jgi:indole-3-glycerol phosphate synthase
MSDFLKKVIAQKEIEVAQLKKEFPRGIFPRGVGENPITQRKIKSLKNALSTPRSIIAEIKRASPAKGPLSDISDPTALAQTYQQAGAAAISVLTDELFFKGSIQDLKQVSQALQDTSCVILRKEFIIDNIQLEQALHAGADAVLLIVAVLGGKTQTLIDEAHALGLEVLLEVHTEEELHLALKTNADVIGINNRNLNTLVVDVQTSLDLISHIPTPVVRVSESGIHTAEIATQLFDAGFHGLLIGEALVRAENPAQLLQILRGKP